MGEKILSFLFGVGRIFSPCYALIMRGRSWLYGNGVVFKTEHLPVQVVSVGNLTLGGTGKTPLVQYVARFARGHNRKVAVVSRGYGGRSRDSVNIVSDGRSILMDAQGAGDEPVLHAEQLPGVPVLTAKKRSLAARVAMERFGVDTIILDDGFQHLGLARDLDLVLFSARRFLGNGRVFPGGPLREPLSALCRASAFVITGVDKQTREDAELFRSRLQKRFPGKPVFMGEFLPVSLVHSQKQKTFAIEKARRIPLYGFAGIGTPESFRSTLDREEFLVIGFESYPDHHAYTRADFERLVARAKERRAAGLITTEKDFVKLRPFFGDFPVLAVRVELYLEEGFDLYLADFFTRRAPAT